MTDNLHNPISGDEILGWADSDKAPEELIQEFGEEMDGADIPEIFATLADHMGYISIESFLLNEPQLARNLIDTTQSNPDKSWGMIWRIAICQDALR